MTVNVLLLNPPGKRMYIRDYYCSKASRTNYVFHPVDLLLLSGRLAQRYEVTVIDANADRLDAERCVTLIDRLAPDVIVSMIGAVSLDEDVAFLEKLKKPARRIVVSGDVVLEHTGEWLRQHDFIDAALLDFTSEDIVAYIEGETIPLEFVVRNAETDQPMVRKRAVNLEFSLPLPRHDLFISRHYRFPFARHKEFATVLTDYGCPYHCTFCNMSSLGYKYRPVTDIIEELRLLRTLGRKEIFFIDQTFGANRKRALDLCGRMEQERFTFGWSCFTRVDLLTEELAAAMQGSGCHTVMLGVETASAAMLEAYGKGYTKARIQDAFRLCKTLGLRTVATFVLGLPEETEDTARETIAFARELDCDFASFNIAVPRMGTLLRQIAIQEGLIRPDIMMMDQAGSTITMPSRHLTKARLGELRKQAIQSFYLRPGYLWKRLIRISTLYELREQLFEGWALLSSLWKIDENTP